MVLRSLLLSIMIAVGLETIIWVVLAIVQGEIVLGGRRIGLLVYRLCLLLVNEHIMLLAWRFIVFGRVIA